MSVPSKIDVGPLSFVVTQDLARYGQAVETNDGRLWGQIYYATGELVLNPAQAEGHKRLCLLHEILHACWHLTDYTHNNDEDAVRRLAAPLLETLRRNPALVTYLMEVTA